MFIPYLWRQSLNLQFLSQIPVEYQNQTRNCGIQGDTVIKLKITGKQKLKYMHRVSQQKVSKQKEQSKRNSIKNKQNSKISHNQALKHTLFEIWHREFGYLESKQRTSTFSRQLCIRGNTHHVQILMRIVFFVDAEILRMIPNNSILRLIIDVSRSFHAVDQSSQDFHYIAINSKLLYQFQINLEFVIKMYGTFDQFYYENITQEICKQTENISLLNLIQLFIKLKLLHSNDYSNLLLQKQSAYAKKSYKKQINIDSDNWLIYIIINHSTCLIIFLHPMQGFKGLVPRPVLTDEAFQPIQKKAEEHRKAAQICIDFFQQINKFFQSFSTVVQKSIQDSDVGDTKASYYRLIGFTCTRLLKENKILTENTKNSSKELTKVCIAILDDFSKYLQTFQGNIRKYQQSQLIIQQLSKKYFRTHKNMLSSIESYKNSFTDVTLIYNMQQKQKRYQTCEANYKAVTAQYNAICEKSEGLNQRKAKIIKNCEELKDQFTKVVKMIGSKVIGQTKNFINYYCSANKSIITFVAEQKYNLQKQQLAPFFANIDDPSNPQIFNLTQIPPSKMRMKIPKIFQYPHLIKQQFLESYNSQMLSYLKVVQQNIQNRKIQSKKINELFNQYFKNIQRVHIIGVKQVSQNFDKFNKKLAQNFGSKLVSFVKSIKLVFQLLSGIDQKMVKKVSPKLQSVQQYFNQQNKLLKLFGDELRSNIQKFIGKKQLKKLKQDEFTQQGSIVNTSSYRKQITQKANFIKHLMQGFNQKMAVVCSKISKIYTDIINDLSESINQFYSLCCEYQVTYFGPDQFSKKFQIYQNDIDNVMEKSKSFFQQLSFNAMLGDTSKVVFDGQFSKVQDFKKIKKPVQNSSLAQTKQEELKQGNVQSKQTQQQNQKSPRQSNGHQRERSPLSGGLRKNQNGSKQSVGQIVQMSNQKKQSIKEPQVVQQKQTKNLQFLMTKIQFKANQQYIKSFSCALSEKIVLQGRIYITSQRICFSSGFNSSNLFFGKTFIQFPKQDITKIQKRLNGIFIDNSISITTVKGQLFFTSFFSRNQAYNLICKTFNINMDDHVYQFEQQQQGGSTQIKQIKEADDIHENQLQVRRTNIQAMMTNFAYGEAAKIQIVKQGLTAFQIFKIFYSNHQIVVNRRKHLNFLSYIKQQLGHKDVEVDVWDPPLQKIMNQSNIKSVAPLKTTRKIRAVVPVANSGVPFMPKTAKSEQIQNLHFFSKHKWVNQAQISTSGAPYTDTFKVMLRTIATSDQSGKCQVSILFYVNFVKQTMMKSVIQSKSQQQTIKASKLWLDQMKKYFANLQKAVKKQGSNPVDDLKQELQQRNLQLDTALKQRDNLKKQIQQLKINGQKQFKIIIGLSVLSFILLLLLIS